MTTAELITPSTFERKEDEAKRRYAECFLHHLVKIEKEPFLKAFYLPEDQAAEQHFIDALGLQAVNDADIRLSNAGIYDNLQLMTSPFTVGQDIEIIRQELSAGAGAIVTYFAHRGL